MLEARGRNVSICQGDTALLTLHIRSAYRFKDADRAVFTISRPTDHAIIGRCTRPITPNGFLQVPLMPEDTLSWVPMTYDWDLRVVLNATLDKDGGATGGDEIDETTCCPGAFVVKKAVTNL